MIFTSKEHEHDVIEEKRGIDPATKVEIEILYKIGTTKPKAILAALEQKNVPIPSCIQLANYLAQLKNIILGKSSISKKNTDVPIGLKIRLGFLEPPSAAKDDGIEQKRKRGRPQKAQPALCKQ